MYVDLHSHLTNHLPYGFLISGGGPEDKANPNLTYRHTFDQHMYRQLVEESGTSIFVNAALVNIFSFSERSAIRQIKRQFDYLEEFVRRNSSKFVLARCPDEAREAIKNKKIVFVHALEGADYLLDSDANIEMLKKNGVAMVAPVHLSDNHYGAASIMVGAKAILNFKGLLKRAILNKKKRGLTRRGRDAIKRLAENGIIVDTAHMSPSALDDTLEVLEEMSIPLIMSHGGLYNIRREERGLTDEQVRNIYNAGGMIGINGGQDALEPLSPNHVELPEDYSPRTLDDFILHYNHLKTILHENQSVGWASDFNGLVSHYRPKYGPDGEFYKSARVGDRVDGIEINEFDVKGLQHAGSMKSFWKALDSRGVDLTHINSSAERFLTIWESVLALGQ
jgi:microsomal dipeptidase-like Zn-dependent dipeptidase